MLLVEPKVEDITPDNVLHNLCRTLALRGLCIIRVGPQMTLYVTFSLYFNKLQDLFDGLVLDECIPIIIKAERNIHVVIIS